MNLPYAIYPRNSSSAIPRMRGLKSLPRILALGGGIGMALVVLVTLTRYGTPVDAWCYYGFDGADPWRADGCFLYSPPVEAAMGAIRSVIPFDFFTFILRSAEVLVLVAVAGPAVGLVLWIPAVATELNAANINLLIVGAVLIGFRYPWAWAFIALTKITPGIGMLWFAVRREWTALAIATGATLGLALVSGLAAPDQWGRYVAALMVEPDSSVFLIWWRLPLAAVVVIWGARNDHRWAVLLAVFLSLPRWYFLSPVILVGLFPLVRLPRPLPGALWVRSLRPGSPAVRASAVQPAAATSVQPAAATSEGRTAPAPSS